MAHDIRRINKLCQIIRENNQEEIILTLDEIYMNYSNINLISSFNCIMTYLKTNRLPEYDDVLLLSLILREEDFDIDDFNFEEMNQERLLKNSLDIIRFLTMYEVRDKIYDLVIQNLALDFQDVDFEYSDILSPWDIIAIENRKYIRPLELQLRNYREAINLKKEIRDGRLTERERTMPKYIQELMSVQIERLSAELAALRREERARIDNLILSENSIINLKPPVFRVHNNGLVNYYGFDTDDDYYDFYNDDY